MSLVAHPTQVSYDWLVKRSLGKVLGVVAAAGIALAVAFGTAAMVGSCIAVSEGQGMPTYIPGLEDAQPEAAWVWETSTVQDAKSELPLSDPHAVLGITPSHGPFTGGRTVQIRGAGFSNKHRVWFGDVEVPQSDIIVGGPTRLQALVPPGKPGQTDVHTQRANDTSTRRTLRGGYTYDAYYVEPSSGPTSGGTIVHVVGRDTEWSEQTRVLFAGKPCTDAKLISPQELSCVTPPNPEGSVAVTVQHEETEEATVYDAFTYADSDNGFKGGLSGNPLRGTLKVSAFNAYTGAPVVDAHVIAGSNLDDALVSKTNASGMVVFTNEALQGSRTVTIAKDCYQPTSFVDVPVDTVTAYLLPVLTMACLGDSGEIPPVGGQSGSGATLKGELVWPGYGVEFKRAPWTNVPEPKNENERQVAYLFQPSWDSTVEFSLPHPSQAILPTAKGTVGYAFSTTTWPGNITLYALAGIENRTLSPPVFTAYAMGITQGITAKADTTSTELMLLIDKPLDQAVQLSVKPPTAGPKGPDRLVSNVAVKLGSDGYLIFPNGQRTTLLSSTGDLLIVGLPGLTGSLAGANYISTAKAVTGPSATAPLSIIGKYLTQSANVPVFMDGFVQVPVLVTPAPGEAFDGRHLKTTHPPGGAFIDVTVFRIQSTASKIEWMVIVPGSDRHVELPDLSRLGVGLPKGSISIHVFAGDVNDADYSYGNLMYRHADSRGWAAYAYDVFHGYY